MRSHWRTFLAGVCFLAVLGAAPVLKADSIDFSIKVEKDDAKYFQFDHKDAKVRERHNPMVWKAARDLRQAKHKLWMAGGPDFGGYRVKAIADINRALADLWKADQYDIRHPDKRGMKRGHDK